MLTKERKSEKAHNRSACTMGQQKLEGDSKRKHAFYFCSSVSLTEFGLEELIHETFLYEIKPQ